MNIVKIKSKDNLKKVIKALKGRHAQFLVASEIIRRKDLPKDSLVLNYVCLIPPPVLITMYSQEGRTKEYDNEYIRSIAHPATAYFINEAILTSAEMNMDLFLVCAMDEDEYAYIDLTCEFIEERYNVKPLSAKKYLEGKSMKGDVRGLDKRAKIYKEKLGNKLKDAYIDIKQLFDSLIYDKDKKKLKKK